MGDEAVRSLGRYALFDALSSGGMGTVHLGRLLGPVGFSRTVAIKRLHENYSRDANFVAQFTDEARLAARIRHPNVVATLDVVSEGEGELFIVIDYVHGETLARLLDAVHRRSARVPIKVAVAIVAGALHGLHAAHEATNEAGESLHIVHRDVSPQNIIVGVDGVPRVLDFGVAHAAHRLQTTRDGVLKGKLGYIAPEQLQRRPLDRRADVYAASIVLWETLSLQRLFEADSEVEIFTRVLYEEVPPPRSIVPDLPAELDAIVMKGLARDPAQRFQTAREMALALEDAVAPATAAQIGAWVEENAHDALVARAKLVAKIEHPERARATTPVREAAAREEALPAPRPSSRARTLVVAASLVAAGALAVVLWQASRAGRITSAAAAPASPGVGVALSASPPASPPSSSPAPSVVAVAPSAVADPPVVDAAARPTAPAPARRKSAPPEVAPRAAAPAPPPSSPAVDACATPYVIDAMGRKIYKRECLR